MSPPCDSSPWLAATVRVLLKRVATLEKSLNEEFLMSQVVAALGSKQAQPQAEVPFVLNPAAPEFIPVTDTFMNPSHVIVLRRMLYWC